MAGSTAAGGDVWRITGEERAKHDAQFFQLKPVNGFITGEQAKGFFMQSGLPTLVLGQIWTLADINGDGKMDKKEFSIAMHLIKKKLQGYELPKSLPANLKADPTPIIGSFGAPPMPPGMTPPVGIGMAMGVPPPLSAGMIVPPSLGHGTMTTTVLANGVMSVAPSATYGTVMMTNAVDSKVRSGSFTVPPSSAVTWSIPQQNRLKYTQLFNSHDRNKKGFLTGVESRPLLLQSGLPQPILAQVWSLSDVDNDGKLSCDEFCIAMYLIDVAKIGQTLPQKLPPSMMPAGMKTRSGSISGPTPPPISTAPVGSQNDAFGDLLTGMGLPGPSSTPPANGDEDAEQKMLQVTFEDRRKENFEKGQAELERRRAILQEQLKREEHARLEKERQEQEKRERIRQEQERKRLMELERQLEKQREIEREREEQRRKMMEQREAARRELERQRQMEWERQRKEQLLTEKHRENEQLETLKSQNTNLKCELEALDGKKTELAQKITQVRNGVTNFTTSIERMRQSRDLKLADIERFQLQLQDLTQKYLLLQQQKEQLNIKVETATPTQTSEMHRTLSHSVEMKKALIEKLKRELEETEKETQNKLQDIDTNTIELNGLNKQVGDLQGDLVKKLQQKQSTKHQDVVQWQGKQRESEENCKWQDRAKQQMREDFDQEKQKSQGQQSPWFEANFSSPSIQPTVADDTWANAFASQPSSQSGGGGQDMWADAFSSQSSTDKPTTSKSGRKKYKAIYQFDARNPDEISLVPGEIIWVPDDQSGAEPGWMDGEKDGRHGWFPKDYVEFISREITDSGVFTLSGAAEGETNTDIGQQAVNTIAASEDSSFTAVQSRPVTGSPTPGQGQAAPEGLQAVALYPWKAKKENHLTFNKNDVIIVKVQQDMWWSGELNGKEGWFPKSYVKLIGTAPPKPRKRITTTVVEKKETGSFPLNLFPQNVKSSPQIEVSLEDDNTSDARLTGSLNQKAEVSGDYFVAMFKYTSIVPTDLTFNQGEVILVTKMENDWWTGQIGNREGIFPANYVKKMDVQDDTAVTTPPESTAPEAPLHPEAPSVPPFDDGMLSAGHKISKKPEIASVIVPYAATGPEQLSLQPGQLIQVRKKSPSGWWEGELQARGQKRKIGWFPANYVKLLGSSSARSTPDLPRSISPIPQNHPPSQGSRTATPVLGSATQLYVEQVRALYPYAAQMEDELTFQKDSVINVINKDDPDWWKGEVNGSIGVFPSNYVESAATSAQDQFSYVSGDENSFQQSLSKENKRQNCIQELFDTEESYMADMSNVVVIFQRPLMEAKVLSEEEQQTIFVNWKELIICNKKLLQAFRVRRKIRGKGNAIQTIGDLLCENLPHMTPYVRFCSCQLNAAALLQHKTENSPEFKEIHKKCLQDPRTKAMPLSSFLLKPIQRITKYPLFIKKILDYTPQGHPDHQHLTDALTKAEELCSQVNEGVQEKENSNKLEWIQQHMQCDGLAEKLTFNSVTNCLGPRKFLYSGSLYKSKSNKELVGFLFNDFLLLALPQRPLGTFSVFSFDVKATTQFRMYKTPIVLNEVMVKKPNDGDADPCQFQLCHIDRIYNLKAVSNQERDSWVKHIETASRNYLETERKRREKAHSSHTQIVGRLLVILLEGINLTPSSHGNVKRTSGVGRLLVVIMEACDLKGSDRNGKSDPYCEVSMGMQEHKTKVISGTLNPRWNASMQFTIRDLQQDVLCIAVFDRDLFSPNDFLGRTEVCVADIIKDSQQKRGPIMKKLLLHEVDSGEIIVKLDLQLYESA